MGVTPADDPPQDRTRFGAVERPDFYWMVAGQCVGRKASLKGITMKQQESKV